jgi:hypothetical protein
MIFLLIIKDPLPGEGNLVARFAVVWIFGFIITLLGAGLKRVRIDDKFIYVSNYQTEIRVPLTEIADVTQTTRVAFPTVTVHFRAPTAFGSEISFMTPARFGVWAGSPHPIVDELKQLARRAAPQPQS